VLSKFLSASAASAGAGRNRLPGQPGFRLRCHARLFSRFDLLRLRRRHSLRLS
jgi:hypothetical protein